MPASLDDFQVISTIGTGSYGTCKKICRKKDGKILVWKEMEYGSMTEAEKQMLVSEVNLLRELHHQHIVKYYDRIIDRTKAMIYIIMEYCEGGDLATLIAANKKNGESITEDFAWKILIQTTLALKECHRRKNGQAVLHRDLKPANVFLDKDSNVKLGDFGLARVLHSESSFAQTYVGTPYYMSPELVNNLSYNEKSDIWALGCMMYELCALSPPFTASNQSELNRKIRLGDFPRLPLKYSIELDMIIRKMIQVEVAQRPSIGSILADPLVQKRREALECNVVSTRTNSSDNEKHDLDNIEKLRNNLIAKMRQLELKEKELESREKSVALREQIAEEKLKRAMSLLDQVRHRDDYSTTSQTSVKVTLPDNLSDASLKRQVTFHPQLFDKENLRQKIPHTGLVNPLQTKSALPYNNTSLENQLGFAGNKITHNNLLHVR
ncbi:serine/threonine-protein kinase Nek2-like isoform X2 [Biomphalaria glabrata]|nr:serine/threonine-protein kinase Nek2-like isoform X2 [Biomphalaria glabrata]XP_013067084.2 serine/threonine-protein kinase Nek2-like isoform X2 [Biomphalaria glabrata]